MIKIAKRNVLHSNEKLCKQYSSENISDANETGFMNYIIADQKIRLLMGKPEKESNIALLL